MADRGEHFGQCQRGDLSVALAAADGSDGTSGNFNHTHVAQRIAVFGAKADAAFSTVQRRTVARIIGDAQLRERPQCIIIGTVIPRAERHRRGRSCRDQGISGKGDQFVLLVQREISEVVACAPGSERIGAARKAKPFGVAMQLHVLPRFDDRADDVLNRRYAPDK